MAKKRMQLIAMFSVIVFLRFLFIFIMGPMPQDAYYFFYSQHLALSYFDHPPMIAYMLRLFSAILGNNVIAIKVADSFVTFLTIVFFSNLASCFLGPRQLKKAMLLLISTLLVTIMSLVSTPDAPLLLFWTLSLYFLYQAIFRRTSVYWLWSGIAMGLAFDSKYTAVFLPAGLILFLILSKPYRHYLLSKWFWLAVVSFFVIVSPVVIWNAGHNFASFKFQSTSRMGPFSGIHLQIKY
ncbi:MAG TPA: glycosyltransferase family 39 protein, partial [Pedobacter sp.]